MTFPRLYVGPHPQEAKDLYIQAKLSTVFGSDNEPEANVPWPGGKTFQYREGDLWLVDTRYETPGSTKTWGNTIIFYQNIPCWTMLYWGWYEVEAVPFLKSCLAKAYDQGLFVGGRGPRRVDGVNMVYVNNPERDDGIFNQFSGGEAIYAKLPEGQNLIGALSYQGMWTWPR